MIVVTGTSYSAPGAMAGMALRARRQQQRISFESARGQICA
jgi:hypothetical protein